MAERGEAVRLLNPFSSAQREGRELTVKFVLWETLARHYPNGARVAELEKDERLLEMRPKMRAAKNLNGQARSGRSSAWRGSRRSPPPALLVVAAAHHLLASPPAWLQITGELGSDKGVHFIKDFNGQPGVWGVRLDTAAAAGEQPRGGRAAPAPSTAPAQQQGADADTVQPQQEQEQHPPAQAKQAARGHKAAPLPSPPVPGNESEAAPWAGASCQYLTDRLWKKGVAVWWPAEQQYFNGKIIGQFQQAWLGCWPRVCVHVLRHPVCTARQPRCSCEVDGLLAAWFCCLLCVIRYFRLSILFAVQRRCPRRAATCCCCTCCMMTRQVQFVLRTVPAAAVQLCGCYCHLRLRYALLHGTI